MTPRPSEIFVAGMWKILILRARKSLACWKQDLMGHSGGMEDKNAEKNMEAWLMKFQSGSKTLHQEVG